MGITRHTRVRDLLETHPALEPFLLGYHPEFERLGNPVMRATLGRVATLERAAEMASIDPDALIADIAAELERLGETEPGGGADTAAATAADTATPEARQAVLKDIIRDLHDGAPVEAVKQRFAALVSDVDAAEIASLEQALIAEGLPVEEVQRLCDVHVRVFEEGLDAAVETAVPAGHPVDSYRRENVALGEKVEAVRCALEALQADPGRVGELVEPLADLRQLDTHYTRKENQLFPALEHHDISGPSQVMWALHDEIRGRIKAAAAAASAGETEPLLADLPETLRMIVDMAFKEEKILFPTALEALTDAEWQTMRMGEQEIGFAWIEPPALIGEPASATAGVAADAGEIPLKTGALSAEQVDLLLRTLPFDVTFVDHEDRVRYYSEGDRIFPRSPGIIGRAVQNCHPPASVHVVEQIVEDFRTGARDSAEFWIEVGGRFVHIRYFAVRDERGVYRGVVEVSQDITDVRALEGEKRLLD